MQRKCINCGEPLKDDAVFCTKCGAKQPVEKKCPNCGAPIKAGMLFCAKQDFNENELRDIPKMTSNNGNSSNQNNSLKIIIGVLIAIIVIGAGGGFYYYKITQNNATVAESSSSSEVVSSDTANSSEKQQPAETKPEVKDNLAQARDILESKNFGFGIKAVSNITDDGFLAYSTDEGVAFIAYDKKDDVITPINFDKKLLNIANGKKEDSIILTLYKSNDTASKDSKLGYWEGEKHIFSVFSDYTVDGSGNVVPGMLTSGAGRNPSHFQSYLQEQENVNIVNLALTHADSLRQDMQARNIQY